MALFSCNNCGFIREIGNDYLGKSVKCPKCESIKTIYDTAIYVGSLIKRYIETSKELQALKSRLSADAGSVEVERKLLFAEIDIYNTDHLTKEHNLEPVVAWFKKSKIEVNIDKEAVDTRGFFDEVAVLMGDNYHDLSFLCSQIKYNQSKGFETVKFDLSKKSTSEIKTITTFCKALYDYSFVAKYFQSKKEKEILLTLQKAPNIRYFFSGIWMEWFVFIKVLAFFHEQGISPACIRSLQITFSDGVASEIDIFVLTEKGIPIYIECKSGEFRHDIDKYLSLRKRLNINKNQFVICVFGLSQEQASGMTRMYDLTFVNEASLITHIQAVV